MLATHYRDFSLEELRWDYLCNIPPEFKALILDELKRRKVSIAAFEELGKGKPRRN
jgi:hypothetical protein